MTQSRKLGWRATIILLAALACAGTWAAGQVRSVRGRSEVAKMTEKMKPMCIGRFLIGVPAQAEISVSRERIAGFAVEAIEENQDAFRKRIAARGADIAARGLDPDRDSGIVEACDLRVPHMVGRLLIYGRSHGHVMEGERRVDMEWVSIEPHGHMDGLSISLSATGHANGQSMADAQADGA